MTDQTRHVGSSSDGPHDYRTRRARAYPDESATRLTDEGATQLAADAATRLSAEQDDELTAVAARLESLYSPNSSSGSGGRSASALSSRTPRGAATRATRRDERSAAAPTSRLRGGGSAEEPRNASAFSLRQGGPSRGSRSRADRSRRGVARGSRSLARIAAPVIFLVVVVALLGMAIDSGVFGGRAAAPSPTPSVRRSVATKTYVVKSGDTFSGIAARLHADVETIRSLNPTVRESALVVGQKIRVPKR